MLARPQATCLHCGRSAPIVYRGVFATCSACGALRVPLSGPSINLAGKPARAGEIFAAFVGWLVLGVGLAFALGVGLLAYLVVSLGVALALSLPLALAAVVIAALFLAGSRRLHRSAIRSELGVREQAVFAAAQEGGAVTAAQAAQSLGISFEQADSALTDLAKREPERLAVDVDDNGVVWFRPTASPPQPAHRVRVGSRGAEHLEPGAPRADAVGPAGPAVRARHAAGDPEEGELQSSGGQERPAFAGKGRE